MKIFIFLLFTIGISASTFAEITSVKGIYQGKNLFVQNPLINKNKREFCIDSVMVNGHKIPDETHSSAFIISLEIMKFKLGEKITVAFYHKDDCEPMIINPEVLKPLSTFKLKNHKMKDDYLICKTTRESSQLTFFIEEYRWDRWLTIDEIKGKGGPDDNTYKIKVYPHNGKNMYRLKQVDHMNRVHYSDTMKYQLDIDPVELKTKNVVTEEIAFSKETLYQLYNRFGERVRFGGGTVIDVSDLSKGIYFLSYGDNVVEIKKR
ncbi:MAG: hypothetical protein ACQES1_02700 [Bacteroidota bacterium]